MFLEEENKHKFYISYKEYFFMKRKVIQLAKKTHVISLPSKWIKNFNIKKGDELDLEERGNSILIELKNQETELKKMNINIDKFNEKTLKFVISALHKLGYDEITCYYENQEIKKKLDVIIPQILGFVSIEQTSKKTTLKSISNEKESEFNPALRRNFLVTITLAKSSLEMISSKKFSELESLRSLEKTNNQLTSFCLRIINKGIYKDQKHKQFLVIIIGSLGKIADDYKSIIIDLSENKEEIDKEILRTYEEVNNIFIFYYELFYNFSIEKINEVTDKDKELNKKIKMLKSKTEEETKLIIQLSTILSKIIDLSTSIVAINHESLRIKD